MNVTRLPTRNPKKLFIRVFIDDAENKEVVSYYFDYNDPVQRSTFVDQAYNAWFGGQSVTTILESEYRKDNADEAVSGQ